VSKDSQAVARPGSFLRAVAGAWHVPAAFAFLVGRPRLWALAALPALLAGALLVLGLVLGVYAVPYVDDLVNPSRGARGGFGALVSIALWLATPLAGMVIGLALALMLTAPILERLSIRVEQLARGQLQAASRGLEWEIVESLRAAFYFAARAPGFLLVSLVPLIGPPIGALWGAHSLAFQLTEGPLARRGLGFSERRAWHRRYRAESLGFGLAGLLTLLVPLANLLLAPALVVGATRLVLDLVDFEEERARHAEAAAESFTLDEMEDSVARANRPRSDPWDLPK
jgi:uncharacterized protein involved in cysteine biosynthesis